MSRLRPICRFVSPLADSRSTSRILRTDNLSAAIPSPESKSAGKDGLRGEGVQRRRRQPAWSTSTETAGQLAPKRVVRFDRNGWSAWSETSGQIGAKYASTALLLPWLQFLKGWSLRQTRGDSCSPRTKALRTGVTSSATTSWLPL